MKKLELTKDELEKLYHLPPKDVEKETEFQITYRMGRNSLVLELIKKIDGELTPHIEYHPNGNVSIKGQKNSKGQQEGIWEGFYPSGNIYRRTSYVEGKEDGIVEFFDEQGNIIKTYVWKNGELIEETKPELTPHIEYHPNGNVRIKGRLNSKGEREGIWEWFSVNGNIRWRTPYKEGNEDGIEEEFDKQGNIIRTRHWKDGK